MKIRSEIFVLWFPKSQRRAMKSAKVQRGKPEGKKLPRKEESDFLITEICTIFSTDTCFKNLHPIYYSLINRGDTFEVIPCFIIDSLRLPLHRDNPGVDRDADQFFEAFYVVMGMQSTYLT